MTTLEIISIVNVANGRGVDFINHEGSGVMRTIDLIYTVLTTLAATNSTSNSADVPLVP